MLDKLADERELTVDQNDLTAHIIRKAQQENTAPQQIADHLQEHPHHIDEYMTEIRRGKALGVLVSAATITDSAGERVDLDRLRPDGSLADDQADDQSAGEIDDQASESVGEISGERADHASISGEARATP